MQESTVSSIPIAETFDVGTALEIGWKGYAKNFGMGTLLCFIGMLLLVAGFISVVGIVFAVPHIGVGLGMVGYYMVRGPLKAGALFSGFSRYGAVLGAGWLIWLIVFGASLIFSAPYYYHLFKSIEGSSRIAERLLTAQLDPEMQGWMMLSYAAIPVQLYLQGRLMIVFPLIIEQRTGVFEAIAVSWRVTSKVHGYVFLYYLLVMLLTFVGVFVGIIALIVGMFFVIPFPMAAIGAAMQLLMNEGYPQWLAAPQQPSPPN